MSCCPALHGPCMARLAWARSGLCACACGLQRLRTESFMLALVCSSFHTDHNHRQAGIQAEPGGGKVLPGARWADAHVHVPACVDIALLLPALSKSPCTSLMSLAFHFMPLVAAGTHGLIHTHAHAHDHLQVTPSVPPPPSSWASGHGGRGRASGPSRRGRGRRRSLQRWGHNIGPCCTWYGCVALCLSGSACFGHLAWALYVGRRRSLLRWGRMGYSLAVESTWWYDQHS